MKYLVGAQPTDWQWYLGQTGVLYGLPATLAALAANISAIQLINPAGSGVDVHLSDIEASLSVAGDVLISQFNTNLTTAVGAGIALRSGGAAAKGLVKTQQQAGNFGTAVKRISLPVAQSIKLIDRWEHVLAPGKGLVVQSVAQNVALVASFAWMEYGS